MEKLGIWVKDAYTWNLYLHVQLQVRLEVLLQRLEDHCRSQMLVEVTSPCVEKDEILDNGNEANIGNGLAAKLFKQQPATNEHVETAEVKKVE